MVVFPPQVWESLLTVSYKGLWLISVTSLTDRTVTQGFFFLPLYLLLYLYSLNLSVKHKQTRTHAISLFLAGLACR